MQLLLLHKYLGATIMVLLDRLKDPSERLLVAQQAIY